jgi:hypothetical protein
MAGQDDQRSTGQSLNSLEVDLIGAVMDFHQKTTRMLRESGLSNEKLTLIANRTKLLTDRIVDELKQPQSFNLETRLDAAYLEVKEYVNELSERRGSAE